MPRYEFREGAVHGSVGGLFVSMPWNGLPEEGLKRFAEWFPNAEDEVFEIVNRVIEYDEDEWQGDCWPWRPKGFSR